jgi:serine phosphatase RsbU (regulator of sigma subunit)
VPQAELAAALRAHKALVRARFPATRGGQGADAYVDAGDLGGDLAAYRRRTDGGYAGGASCACGAGAVAPAPAKANGHAGTNGDGGAHGKTAVSAVEAKVKNLPEVAVGA